MKKLYCGIYSIIVVLFVVFGITLNAGATGKGYTSGSEGVLAATIPPPGFHYRMYNVFYESDTLKDDNGNEIKNQFDVSVLAQAHRFIYITSKKFLGADYGVSAIVPVVATDFEIGAISLKDSEIGLGDIFIEPLVLGWHEKRHDIGLGLGFNLPTGGFDQAEPASCGSGYWSGLLTFGGTYYFDDKKSLSGSILTRTLIYGEQEDTDLEPGSEFIVDFGFGMQVPFSQSLLVRPGLCGYGYWQLSEDKGPGIADDKGTVYAIGAEVNLFWLPPALYQANLRVLSEFGAEDETEGIKMVLTMTKSF